ncbi:hypothetical protein Ddc_02732 [Ditylenchus destructor]|nr:hypothetical protein Ddc_02732 [Ditylenchus destructor]
MTRSICKIFIALSLGIVGNFANPDEKVKAAQNHYLGQPNIEAFKQLFRENAFKYWAARRLVELKYFQLSPLDETDHIHDVYKGHYNQQNYKVSNEEYQDIIKRRHDIVNENIMEKVRKNDDKKFFENLAYVWSKVKERGMEEKKAPVLNGILEEIYFSNFGIIEEAIKSNKVEEYFTNKEKHRNGENVMGVDGQLGIKMGPISDIAKNANKG